MPDPLSIGTGIVTFLGVAGKILQKCGEIQNAVPQIQQILTEAESFKAMVILLQGLLLERSEEALDNQSLLKVATLMRVLQGCTDTFEQLEKELDGLMEDDMKIGKSNVGKWMLRQGDIVAMLRNLESHKLTLSLILEILNCHQEQKERQVQKDMLVEMQRQLQLIKQQNALLLNVIMGGIGTLPIGNMQHRQSMASIAESVASGRRIPLRHSFIPDTSQGMLGALSSDDANFPINTPTEELNELSGGHQLQRTASYSAVVPEPLVRHDSNLNGEINIEINFEQILSACGVYNRIRGEDIPSNMTLSEINTPSRSIPEPKFFRHSSNPVRYTYQLIRAAGVTFLSSHAKLDDALISAAKRDSPRVITVLLEWGAHIHAKDRNGATPLHLAVERGYVETTKLLLNDGAGVNMGMKDGTTPLHLAASQGHVEITKLLLEKGADLGLKSNDCETTLHSTAFWGSVEVTAPLLSQGADVNIRGKNGVTPLHLTAWKGHTEITALLLGRGADVNAKQDDGDTPLNLAVLWGHVGVTELLLRHGANVNLRGNDGRTPLYSAVVRNSVEITKLLLGRHADVNLTSNDGGTPLHLVAVWSHVEITNVLLNHWPDVNVEGNDDGTSLHSAAWDRVEVTKLLLNCGADVNVKKNDGGTPLHFAALWGHVAIIELLLSKGADVNQKNNDGNTPLHSAARSGRQGTATVLLARGADIGLKNHLTGETPTQYAARYGHKELESMLLVYEGMINCEQFVAGSSTASPEIRSASGILEGVIDTSKEKQETGPLSAIEEQDHNNSQ